MEEDSDKGNIQALKSADRSIPAEPRKLMPRTFNLADLFEVVAAAVPDRIAFICAKQRISFKALDQRANRLGNALRERGIKRGDNVGIQLYNSAEYLETFLACCKIGAAPVNVNYRYKGEELAFLYASLDFRALVYEAEFAPAVSQALQQAPLLGLLLHCGADALAAPGLPYEDFLASAATELQDPLRSDQDIYMLCTGGTTGMPKGVMWPHRSLFMAALGGGGIYFRRPPIEAPEELAALVSAAQPLVYLACAPLMHGAAMWATLISLFAGHCVVVNDQHQFDAEHVWDIVERDAVNILSIVGDAMALPMIRALEAHPDRWDLSRVMVFGNGGAMFSPHLQQRLKAMLPQLIINNGMGSSEAGLVGGGDKPVQGDGFICITPRPDLALIDEQRRIVAAPGDFGILARSGNTPIGYYGDATKTAETFVTIDGRLWVLTGDQARIDANGDIVVLGRGSECINTGGEKVFPEEVEVAARRYAAVRDVLIIGMPDERWGQKVAAVLELQAGEDFSLAEFDRICRQHLAAYKLPRAVYLAAKVQRSPAGKADYRWAKEYAAASVSLT